MEYCADQAETRQKDGYRCPGLDQEAGIQQYILTEAKYIRIVMWVAIMTNYIHINSL